jgi:hypothetical protein
MGKHLSIEEKLNAETEFAENKEKIKELKAQIKTLKYRNERLLDCIYYKHRSKYQGLYGINGLCYALFKKRCRELDPDERRMYNRIKKAEERRRKTHLKRSRG